MIRPDTATVRAPSSGPPGEGAISEVWRLLSVCFCQPDEALSEAGIVARLSAALAMLGPRCAAAGRALETAAAGTSEQDLLVEYARMFVGPFALPAAPYASVFLDPEGLVHGPTTREVASMYAEAGQAVDPEQHEPPDHVALELEFLALLDECAVEGPPDAERIQRMPRDRELRTRFLAHACSWMPAFCARVRTEEGTRFYGALADCLDSVLARYAADD